MHPSLFCQTRHISSLATLNRIIDVHSHLGDEPSPALRGAEDGNSYKGPVLPWLRSLDAINTHDEGMHVSLFGETLYIPLTICNAIVSLHVQVTRLLLPAALQQPSYYLALLTLSVCASSPILDIKRLTLNKITKVDKPSSSSSDLRGSVHRPHCSLSLPST